MISDTFDIPEKGGSRNKGETPCRLFDEISL